MASEKASVKASGEKASEIIRGLYDIYLTESRKEVKISDVRKLLEMLYKDGIIEERVLRYEVSFWNKDEEARISIRFLAKDYQEMLEEIGLWVGVSFEVVVHTKLEWQKRNDSDSFFVEERRRLEALGFEVSTFLSGDKYCLEGRKILAVFGTAEAYLRARAMKWHEDC